MQREEWNVEIKREFSTGAYPKYPNEVMVKTIFGDYLSKRPKVREMTKVLDVGCAMGSNLIPFADIGAEVYGIDVHEDIANQAEMIMSSKGYQQAVFKEGSNRNIPFEDNYFDLVLSVNTIHYESSKLDMIAALNEFARVLKPGGGLYICTAGPEHEIFRKAALISDHVYEIRDFGFRTGENFFFFDNQKYLDFYCRKIFAEVETGRVTEDLMKMKLDFLIAFATK